MKVVNKINEVTVKLKTSFEEDRTAGQSKPSKSNSIPEDGGIQPDKSDHNSGFSGSSDHSSELCGSSDNPSEPCGSSEAVPAVELKEVVEGHSPEVRHKGRLLVDATACPQDIAYPTDLDLLSDARQKSEQLIDNIYDKLLHEEKPRTYRKIARAEYLHTAQKKKKTKKQIRSAIRKQLGYPERNINSIKRLLEAYPVCPFDKHQQKYYEVIQTLFAQQLTMFKTNTHTIEDRIVSIHQPHVRPIVRGKTSAPVEFGAKISLSLIDGICFLDELSWDAFNEGVRLEFYVEKYRTRFGFYPREVLADKIYCTRENRKLLKELGITLRAKPLGRPSSATALSNHVSPGERNPIEGKFGQAKTAYGLNRIKARLKETSESWIAGIILTLNLVKLAGVVAPCFVVKGWHNFSAWVCGVVSLLLTRFQENILRYTFLNMAVT
jgi:hypothetical protein